LCTTSFRHGIAGPARIAVPLEKTIEFCRKCLIVNGGMQHALVFLNFMELAMSSVSKTVTVFSQALNLRAQRQQVLASNIANADTPHYKARDFDFQSAMQNAMAGKIGTGSVALATTSGGHMRGSGAGGPANLQFRGETQSAVDGNTVDMDVERTQIAENALQYQVLTQLIGDKFKGMRSALASNQG
jgi:flagellar basal-body rod protein FlgB